MVREVGRSALRHEQTRSRVAIAIPCRGQCGALERASDAQRDRFLAAIAAGRPPTPAVHDATPTIESVELLRRTEASDLGPGTLDQLEELVERLDVEYFAVPPAEFREKVLYWRRFVTRLLEGRLTLRERRHLYTVAGWLSGLLAEASLALGDEAEPHCVTASRRPADGRASAMMARSSQGGARWPALRRRSSRLWTSCAPTRRRGHDDEPNRRWRP